MSEFFIKRGAQRPYLDCTLMDDNGAVDLSGFTVTFSMWSSSDTLIVSAAATSSTSGVVTIRSATAGQVRYAWASSDTATAGNFYGEWKWPSSSAPGKFPSDKHIEIVIEPTATT